MKLTFHAKLQHILCFEPDNFTTVTSHKCSAQRVHRGQIRKVDNNFISSVCHKDVSTLTVSHFHIKTTIWKFSLVVLTNLLVVVLGFKADNL